MEMEDDKRNALLEMDQRQMCVPTTVASCRALTPRHRRDVAAFVNSYPTIDVAHELQKGDYTTSNPIELRVTLSRDIDEEDEDDEQLVVAPYYPKRKMANWWVVVGDAQRQLLAIKRVTVKRSLNVKLDVTLAKGQHSLRLYVICDSYSGADHDIEIGTVNVAEGDDSDEDMDSGSDE